MPSVVKQCSALCRRDISQCSVAFTEIRIINQNYSAEQVRLKPDEQRVNVRLGMVERCHYVQLIPAEQVRSLVVEQKINVRLVVAEQRFNVQLLPAEHFKTSSSILAEQFLYT